MMITLVDEDPAVIGIHGCSQAARPDVCGLLLRAKTMQDRMQPRHAERRRNGGNTGPRSETGRRGEQAAGSNGAPARSQRSRQERRCRGRK